MPKLFFDFDDGRTRFTDADGFELADVEAARIEVLRTLGEIAKDGLPRGDNQSFRAHVRDANGNSVYSASVTVAGTWHGSKPVG